MINDQFHQLKLASGRLFLLNEKILKYLVKIRGINLFAQKTANVKKLLM